MKMHDEEILIFLFLLFLIVNEICRCAFVCEYFCGRDNAEQTR